MTILDYHNHQIGVKKSKCDLLSLALSKPIEKSKLKRESIDKFKKGLLDLSLLKQVQSNGCDRVPIDSYYALDWKWDSTECIDSNQAMFSDDLKSVCLNPNWFETQAVRGSKPLKLNAFTYWEVTLATNGSNGTSLMIGVGTKNAKLNSNGYLNLIGIDENSWGLAHSGQIWHDNSSVQFCDPFEFENGQVKIGCLFNGYIGQLEFYKNGKYLGVAFGDLLKRSNDGQMELLYPMVSSTVANSIFKFEYSCESVPSLKELCRLNINRSEHLTRQASFKLPISIRKLLKI